MVCLVVCSCRGQSGLRWRGAWCCTKPKGLGPKLAIEWQQLKSELQGWEGGAFASLLLPWVCYRGLQVAAVCLFQVV